MTMRPYAGITSPTKADRLLTKMLNGAAATGGKGFRDAPNGRHAKGRKPKPTAVERLAAATEGKFING